MPEDSAQRSSEHIYGAQEAAELLGIHRSTLHLAVARNVLVPDAHTPGGHVRFRRATLEAFATRLHCEPATSRSHLIGELVETLDDPEGDIAFCHRAFARIRQAIPAFTMCAVALSTPTPYDPHAIQPLLQEGFPEHLARQYKDMRPQMEFATTTALRTREPELCEDTSRKRALRMGTSSLLRQGELRCFAIIPIVIQDSPLGVLVVASGKPHRIPPPQVSFLQTVASDLGVALSCHLHLHDLRSSMATAADLAMRAQVLRLQLDSVVAVCGGSSARACLGAAIADLSDVLWRGTNPEYVVVIGDTFQHVHLPPRLADGRPSTASTSAVAASPRGGTCQDVPPQARVLFQQMRCSLSPQPLGEAWTDAEGAWSVLILSVPAVGLDALAQGTPKYGAEAARSQERLLVGAIWRGERRERQADELLLQAFGSACALVMSAADPVGSRYERSPRHV